MGLCATVYLQARLLPLDTRTSSEIVSVKRLRALENKGQDLLSDRFPEHQSENSRFKFTVDSGKVKSGWKTIVLQVPAPRRAAEGCRGT